MINRASFRSYIPLGHSQRTFARNIPNFRKYGQVKFDFKKIMDNIGLIEQNCRNRNAIGANPRVVSRYYDHYKQRRYEIDQLRRRRNEHAKAIKNIQSIADDDERSEKLRKYKNVGVSFKEDLKRYEDDLKIIEYNLMNETLKLPNKTHPDSPIGDEDKNEIIFVKGHKPQFDFEPKSHLEIGMQHDLFDFENGGKLTGSKFVFIKNQAALLEMALVNWALSKAISRGFNPIITPDVTKVDVLEGCGFQPRDEAGQTYIIQDDNTELALIGTSEAPLAGMLANEILFQKDFPLKYAAYSHCFRKEAGRGAVAKGMYRLHQFSKVELFVYCEPHDSDKIFDEMVNLQCEMLDELGLHYRGLNMASYELGASAYKKVDLECWFPSKNDFGEITSTSNCTSYQSRRFNIQYLKGQNEKVLAHTLNGTAAATPRLIMAIIENFQTENGGFIIPEALKPFYLGPDLKV
ncbi:unnamed protein product [Moneuplotes crassus]|uniref:serine--tRNA ligase n=1 Tax=Euplotes crassus TaxID=5936 RepID=A0AAD1X6P6_EUPCR|nr:unnamed protein product [Moneuplotes crassus]